MKIVDKDFLIDEIQTTDRAFLNSLLAYKVYETEFPMIEESEIQQKFKKFINQFVNNYFEPVNIDLTENQNIISPKYGYTFDYFCKENEYFALNNLAKAILYKSQNRDGSYTLHLSFRGTDLLSQDLVVYGTKAYTDFKAYYDCFKPLEKFVLEYAKDPENNISGIEVSGHSLGGAMVNEFFASEEVKDSKINLLGYTYGAAASRKRIYHNLTTNLFHGFKNKKFMLLVKHFALGFIYNEKRDERINSYRHMGDLVPIISSFFYRSNGTTKFLNDYSNNDKVETAILDESKKTEGENKEKSKLQFFKAMLVENTKKIKLSLGNKIKKVFKLDYHDMLRYTFNLAHHGKNFVNKEAELENLIPVINDFQKEKEKLIDNFIIEALTSTIAENDHRVKEKLKKLRLLTVINQEQKQPTLS